MRTSLLILAWAAIVVLAAGSASATGEEFEPFEGAVPVGIDIVDEYPTSQTWEATDPRLSGETTCRDRLEHTANRAIQMRAHEWTVANAHGSWTGTRYFVDSDGGESGAVILVLHGAGAYTGLTAYLDWGVEHGHYDADVYDIRSGRCFYVSGRHRGDRHARSILACICCQRPAQRGPDSASRSRTICMSSQVGRLKPTLRRRAAG